jgi:hypothetical protein
VIYEPEAETLPRERLRSLQADRLRSLVDYVKERVPLYRNRLADIEPHDIASLDDLRQLPFTRKGTAALPLDVADGGMPQAWTILALTACEPADRAHAQQRFHAPVAPRTLPRRILGDGGSRNPPPGPPSAAAAPKPLEANPLESAYGSDGSPATSAW